MKLHIITIGQPKHSYAQDGFATYTQRLSKLHTLRVTHIPDKHNDSEHILAHAGAAHKVALVIDGTQLTSEELADFLTKTELDAREVCFIIGGPDGLPQSVIAASDTQLSLSKLTFPHDLAMLILSEALYRASTIQAGHPYHRA